MSRHSATTDPVEFLFLAPGDVRKARVEPISWMRTCHAFAARGLRVTLVTLRVRYPDAIRPEAVWNHFGVPPTFCIRVFPTPLRRGSSSSAFRVWGGLASVCVAVTALGRVAFSSRRLIVYARSPLLLTPFVVLGRLLPRSRRPKLVYETHALPPRSAWRIVGDADLVVVNSRKLEADVVGMVGIGQERVLHAPLPPYAHVRPRPRDEARAELGLPKAAPIACYAGKMLRDQCAFLFDVARIMHTRIPTLHTVLVGGNPDILAWMRRRVAELDLEHTVLLTGFVEPGRVGLYQSAADVLLFYMQTDLPHFAYCTPAKGFDYQATGRPIVARDIPLFDEVFGADGERAIRVREPTPVAFARAIERVISLDDGGKSMGERAMSWIAGRTWQARADAVLDALSRAT
jgi:glycosyltransferase involved in cell wall biosynthesis